MKFKFLFIAFVFCTLSYAQSKGKVSGLISDADLNNEAMPFVNVMIKGTTNGVATDMDGKYELTVPTGNHILVISFVGYETVEIPFEVKENQTTIVNKTIGSGSVKLEDIVIQRAVNREKESVLLMDQKNAVEIKQSIGAQEMSRKATSTVEQGLTKVSGISNVKDRGIFVRGLDDRYNYLLINGLPLASSDPDKKIIPLNYISTNIVGSIDVYKTFNPSLYLDFAGASFEINTKEIPSTPTTVISIGTGFNTVTTLKEFFTDKSGSEVSNFFGYNGSNRNLPSGFGFDKDLAFTPTSEESAGLFDASWTPKKTSAPLDTKFGISHGQKLYEWDQSKVGMFFSLNYNNSHNTQQGARRLNNSAGSIDQDFTVDRYEFSTQKSALLGLNYKAFKKLDLNFATIYLQNSSNSVLELFGNNSVFTPTQGGFFLRDTKYVENDVLAFQLLGDYEWMNKKHQLHFGGSYSFGNNNMPDRRVLRTDGQGEDARYIETNGINPFRFYQQLENTNFNAKVEYELGLQYDETENKFNSVIKAGFNTDIIDYDFYNRTITASIASSTTDEQRIINTNNPEAFFQNGFQTGILNYKNTPDAAKYSNVTQSINAGYLDYSKQFSKILIQVGVRGEYTLREITYREPLDLVTRDFRKLKYNPFDISPSLNVKYTTTEKSNLRFAGSRTITRPRLREVLPTIYQNGDGNQTVGNPDLENSTNYNADLKFEIFPSNDQIFAVGVFGKYIQNPIERLFRFSAGFIEEFGNFDAAYIYGLEIEGKLNVGKTFKADQLNDLSFGFNGILMDSNSKTEDEDGEFSSVTNKDRKLQGASDWGVNADISYQIVDRENINSSVSFIFNTYGKRIFAVGVETKDDVYEKPINQLDFTWTTELNKKFNLRFTIQNILNEKTFFTQNATQPLVSPQTYSNVFESLDLGITFGLNLTYKL